MERIFGVLTQEQRQSLRDVMLDLRETNRETEQKIRDLRAELVDLALDKNFREESFRRKAMEVAKLETERTVNLVKAFSQVQPPLSTQQIERIKRSGQSDKRGSREEPREKRQRPPRDKHDLPPREESPPQ